MHKELEEYISLIKTWFSCKFPKRLPSTW